MCKCTRPGEGERTGGHAIANTWQKVLCVGSLSQGCLAFWRLRPTLEEEELSWAIR